MVLRFQVLVSSKIQRKKSWARAEWIGNNKESVCLLDRNRSSILYLPSGRTKRVIQALRPYSKNIIQLNTSSSGEYIVGLLSSGDIARWHKDSNDVAIIHARPGFSLSSGHSNYAHIFVSNDGCRIVMVTDYQKIDIWEETSQSHEITGDWSSVSLQSDQLKSVVFKEMSVDVVFFTNQIQGKCCLCTFVFKTGTTLKLCSVLLSWCDEYLMLSDHNFTSTLSFASIPLNELQPACHLASNRKCYVTSLSHDGRTIAIAINHNKPHQSTLLFVNVYMKTSVASNIFTNEKSSISQFAKSFWIAKMSWTFDDLFLTCITRCGSLCIFSKMGEPILLASYGLNAQSDLSYFLSFYQSAEYERSNIGNKQVTYQGSPVSSMNSQRMWRQRFSVSTHPRLPLILCSDGYNVTVLQMKDFVTSYDIATASLVEVNRRLKIIMRRYNLEVGLASTPRHGHRLLVKNLVKFKESKYAAMLAYFKAKLKKKKSKSLKDDSNVEENENTEEGFDNIDGTIEMLAYQFEKAEKHEQSGGDEDDIDENMKQSSGIISKPGQSNIIVGSLRMALDSYDDNLSENHATDGESLSYEIKQAVTKLQHAWGLIVSESYGNDKQKIDGTKPFLDELQLYFLKTLESACHVITASQQLSHYLPWISNVDEDTHSQQQRRSLDRSLTYILKTLAHHITYMFMWDKCKSHLVVESLQVLTSCFLKLRMNAPEGCFCIHDIANNLSVCLDVLIQAEKQLGRMYNFHTSVLPNKHDSTDSFHLIDVADIDSYESNTLYLLPVWEQFNSYLSKLFSSVDQLHPSFFDLARFVQRLFLNTVTPLQVGEDPNAINFKNMISYLLEYKLDSAMKVASLVLCNHMNFLNKWNEHDWKSVELLCHVMALYFTNGMLQFHTLDRRLHTLQRDLITSAARSQSMTNLWCPDHVISMLLCCGRLHDACYVADRIGAWRVSICIGAVAEKVRAFQNGITNICWSFKNHISVFDQLKMKFENHLYEILCFSEQANATEDKNMTNESFQFVKLLDYDPELFHEEFVDLFTIGIISGCDLSSWSAKLIVDRLKKSCKSLSFLVHDDIYLPAPPLYLSQPAVDDNTMELPQIRLRFLISGLVRTSLKIFHSMGILQCCVSWYMKKLQDMQSHVDSSPNSDSSYFDDEFIINCEEQLLSSFRDTCVILWMVHARDQLTMSVRKYQSERENASSKEIKQCLNWASKIKPFAKFLCCETQLENLVLCLCMNMTLDLEMASVLAEYFYDQDDINPKIKSRLQLIERKLRQTQVPVDHSGPITEDTSTTQSLSLYYQQQCSIMLQQSKTNSSLNNIFHEDESQAEKQKSANGIEEIDADVSVHHEKFSFETNPTYHQFISQLFDVILGRASRYSLKRSTNRSKNPKRADYQEFPLIISKRHEVATNELENAFKHTRQRKILSKIRRDSECQETVNNVTLQCSKSAESISKTQHSSQATSLPQYFSISDNEHEPAGEFSYHSSKTFNDFKISSAPRPLQKRLHRLLHYMACLQNWMESDVKNIHSNLKPSIHIEVTKDQLLQSLCIAEMRYGRTNHIRTKPLSDTAVTDVSPLVTTSGSFEHQHDNEDAEVTAQHSAKLSPKKEILTPSGKHEEEELKEKMETLKTEVEEAVGITLLEDQPIEEDEVDGTIQNEEETEVKKIMKTEVEEIVEVEINENPVDVKDQSKKVDDIDGITNYDERNLSRDSDHRHQSASNVDRITRIVQSEIHNLLLAQQLSSLNHILLGQEMTRNNYQNIIGQTTNGPQTVIDILSRLRDDRSSSSPVVSTHATMDIKNDSVQSDSPMKPTYPPPARLPAPQRNKFGIPLFNVPDINKAPKVKLIQPPTRKGWNPSCLVQNKSAMENVPGLHSVIHGRTTKTSQSSPTKQFFVTEHHRSPLHVPKIIVKQKENIAGRHVNHMEDVRESQTNERHVMLPTVTTSNREARPPALHNNASPAILHFPSTAYPSTSSHGNIAQPHDKREAFHPPQMKHPRLVAMPRESRLVNHMLIDPREVLSFKHHTFHSTKRVKSTNQKPAMLKPDDKPLKEQAPSQTQVVLTKVCNVEHEPVRTDETQVVLQHETQVVLQHEDQSTDHDFSGFLNQEEINDEMELHAQQCSNSNEAMTQADIHFLTALGKQVASKPRMRDANVQVDDDDDDEEPSSDGDIRNKLKSQPLKPPPDIFSRISEDVPSSTHSGETDADKRVRFLHMSEVNVDAVTRGLPHKPTFGETPHEVHPQDTSITNMEVLNDNEEMNPILSKHVKEAATVKQLRDGTHSRWMDAMNHMSAQVDAMDVMSRKMDHDFKVSAKLVEAIEVIEEGKVPTQIPQSEYRISKDGTHDIPTFAESIPYPQPSFQPFASTTSTIHQHVATSSIHQHVATSTIHQHVATTKHETSFTSSSDEFTHPYWDRLKEAQQLYTFHQESGHEAYRPMQANIPYEAGNDDIISDVVTSHNSTDSQDELLNVENQGKHAEISRQEQLRMIFSEDDTNVGSVKSWKMRNKQEKEEVRQWMKMKKEQRSQDYIDSLKKLREAEKQPFRSRNPDVSRKSNSLLAARKQREQRKKEMLSHHMSTRFNESKKLLNEIEEEQTIKTPKRERKSLRQSIKRSPLKEADSRLNTTYKLHKHQTPYKANKKKQRLAAQMEITDHLSDTSNSSILSTWHVSDDVERVLYGTMHASRPSKLQVTFKLDDEEINETSQQFDDLIERGSHDTESLLADIDWKEVEALVASAEYE